jgi:hypothetical protein
MIFSKCPRCGSGRIRRGYRHTRFWSKLVGRYNLLCDGCNWEFVGFAVPGTVEFHSASRKRKKQASENNRQQTPAAVGKPVEKPKESVREVLPAENGSGNPNRVKVKKRVRIKLNK